MPDDRVPLAAAISGLREQLREATRRANDVPAAERFRITAVELELTVAAEDSVESGGEVGWFVFKAKAGLAAKDAVTHRVKLSLNVGDIQVRSDKQGG